ncbi:YdaU family protein [Dyella japonica]|uniref:Uncharacterized protein YdaU (DUF1376 family) n=1 Tax=Dyella japonica TaxID=231455 RepID=A0ABV2JZ06_9GAMM
MNYYNRYPAHYLAKTILLTLEQDGAYTRLMDWYYSEERAIPHDKRYTIARCQSKRERDAVDHVLSEFFCRQGDAWIHERIEKELHKAAPKIDAARENGKLGGRPRKEKPTGFQNENPLGFQNETHNEPSAKAPQTPNPNNSVGSTEASTQGTTPTDAGRACLLMKQAGCIHANPSHPELLAALVEGVTPETLADTAAEAIATNKRNPFAWAMTTARSRHAEGAARLIVPNARAGPAQSHGKTMGAIMALEGMKDGLDEARTADRISETAYARIGASAGG